MSFLEPVLDEKIQVVALIEDLAADLWVELAEPSNLAILASNQFLIHRGYLDELILFRQVEVRPKELHGVAVVVPFDCELARFVIPGDVVEIEESGKLPFAVVGKFDAVGRTFEVGKLAQLAFASARRTGSR